MSRILVVEDIPANMALACKLLRAAGHDVIAASTGADGVTLTREHRPDLVLMDLGLPDMDGASALREIRADREVATTPVIAFTAHAMNGDRDEALAMGFDGYLSKPIEFATFVDDVASLLP
jgi:CheY-like chemotaxis protein